MSKSLLTGLVSALFVLVFTILISVPHASAVEGSCSWHGGVDCSIGPDWDSSAICNDGWSDSGERYFEQIKCQTVPMCSLSQWAEMSDTNEMKSSRARFSELINSINTLNIEYPMIEIRIQQESAGRGITTAGLAPIIKAAQRVNRNGVATSTYEAQLLDQKMRVIQMGINKECIAFGVARQQAGNSTQQLRLKQAQAALQPTQTKLTDPYAQLTSDERCVKLGLGTFFNTDKQNCDSCSADTIRVKDTNTCQKPILVTKKAKNNSREELPVQAISVVKTQDIKTTEPSEIATTSQATTPSVQTNSSASKPQTFLGKLTSPFRSLWKRFFK